MMELRKIKALCENRKGGLRGLASEAGMTEQNLHRCIREQKIQAQDLYKISQLLGVSISYFFDDKFVIEEYHAHGEKGMAVKKIGKVDQRTMPTCIDSEKGKIEHNGTGHNGVSVVEADLRDQIAILKSQLEDKERIIRLLENKQ